VLIPVSYKLTYENCNDELYPINGPPCTIQPVQSVDLVSTLLNVTELAFTQLRKNATTAPKRLLNSGNFIINNAPHSVDSRYYIYDVTTVILLNAWSQHIVTFLWTSTLDQYSHKLYGILQYTAGLLLCWITGAALSVAAAENWNKHPIPIDFQSSVSINIFRKR